MLATPLCTILTRRLPAAPFSGCQYQTTVTTTADENSSTFTGVNIGTPHPKRLIILGIFQGVAADVTVASVNGIDFCFKNRFNEWCIAACLVPNGTLGDIVVTAASSVRKAVSVWVGYPSNPIPLDFGSATANTTSDANVADQKVQAGRRDRRCGCAA
jgi:hypothetical protein